jgi:hypothetical protein
LLTAALDQGEVQHALDEAIERLQPVAQKACDQATRNPRLVAAVTAAVLVLWRIVRRSSRRRSR